MIVNSCHSTINPINESKNNSINKVKIAILGTIAKKAVTIVGEP
jgi:hypothetical protein